MDTTPPTLIPPQIELLSPTNAEGATFALPPPRAAYDLFGPVALFASVNGAPRVAVGTTVNIPLSPATTITYIAIDANGNLATANLTVVVGMFCVFVHSQKI